MLTIIIIIEIILYLIIILIVILIEFLQGMSREILDAAVVQQFKKYLAKQDKVFEQLTKNELNDI